MNSSLDFTNGNHIRFQFKFNLTKRKFPAKVWQLSFLNAASHLVSYKSKTQIQEQAIILYVLKKTIKQMSSHIYNFSPQQLCFTQWADLSSDFFLERLDFFTSCASLTVIRLWLIAVHVEKYSVKVSLILTYEDRALNSLVYRTSWKFNLLRISKPETLNLI